MLEGIEQRIRAVFRGNYEIVDRVRVDHQIELVSDIDGGHQLKIEGKSVLKTSDKVGLVDYTLTKIRVIVAENAENCVFVHAGALEKNGGALLLPGNSFAGKTTLTVELLKRGFRYLSDEYGVIGPNGNVAAFAKPISLRDGGRTQIDRTPEELGFDVSVGASHVGAVIFLNYEPNTTFYAQKISKGSAILSLLEHALPIRSRPEFTLKTLSAIPSSATFLNGKRGDAREAADQIEKLLDC
ncbi:MAG: hypothetical protein R2684_07455 [Pyrinomonadaceae bacterium]